MKYVIVDLEMCRVAKSNRTEEYRWAQEIIEIGAVLLDENFEMVDRFDIFVKPKYGRLDSFIEKLTGIQEKDLRNAPDFSEAMDKFAAWIPEGDVRCVSWSMTDNSQILHEIVSKDYKNSRIMELLAEWIDCQKLFDEKLNIARSSSLEEALIIADIYQEGNAHSGIDDAYNTALLFKKMNSRDTFEVNPVYKASQTEEISPMIVSLGDLLSGIKLN